MEQEIMDMLEKVAIKQVNHSTDQFLSNILLLKKKDGGNRRCVNLKALNSFVPYQHFKMEGLHCLKYLLKENDYLCKIDLKYAYFSVPLCKESRKYVRFLWLGNLYEFLCLCFGLGLAPRIFSKLLKVPIALLRWLNIRLVIYLDDILLMGQTLEENIRGQDTLIFLLQHLGFIINLKISVLEPTHQLEFLGLQINTCSMVLSLSEEKMKKVISLCQDLLSHPQTTVLELKKLIGLLSSTVQAVLPARLQLRYLQQQQIQALNQSHSYQTELILNNQSIQELLWWVENLRLTNGRSLRQHELNLVIQTDASRSGWGAFCNEVQPGRNGQKQREKCT